MNLLVLVLCFAIAGAAVQGWFQRPRDVEIVESLPKNALQKVLKRELRDRELAKRTGTAGKA